jgi:hypothetical protein
VGGSRKETPITLRAATTVDQAGAGTVITPYTPAASDTFSVNDLPATLRISNANGSSINVTPVDGGKSPLGTAAAALAAVAVANATVRHFKLVPSMADSTGVVTVAFSATSGVSCELTR